MGRESAALVSSPPPTTPGSAASATALAPGFRFHPTDEELVSYYLKRKVQNKPVRFNAIGEVDIYKHEPWELAVYSKLKTRDQEWYFFSALDKKYGNGARMNRATNKGYWKATGKDREIRRDNQLIGMKKTLVFHSGRAPDGLRTNWVMHEYRLVEYEVEKIGSMQQDAYVLCRVFHKNNIGPPSGNRYAPFLEEEWNDGGMALILGEDVRITGEPVPVAGTNEDEQEIQSMSKDLININELPRETQIDNEHTRVVPNRQQHHHDDTPKLQEKDNSLKHDRPQEDCPPLCVLNKEAPLPLLQYKRRRQNDSMGNSHNSSRTTQDHCSSTTTFDNTLTSSAATNTAISALLEFSLMGTTDKKETPPPLPLPPQKVPSPLTPPSNKPDNNNKDEQGAILMPANCTKLINDLQKEIHQMSVERETFKLEMMSAEAMISILQSRIDALRQENEELRKNIKGQCS
ncbi:PREDICTED: NAC domain-containing protein 4 isoform X2 [Tarenaya hassleriana]|uniref:NAC domain-containing protein 4 isoform X1 n=1 Tax=Tarenaya hassleriana TaxID=28532 RepID=UPI00053C5C44|nr:PREDICTED: NAC domain-containing protein 4 isoform X1 [Tarenaya hassleriana]XP_010543580.1 PREDICTED: NAC domain-containing protein 4 isoform X2 [Tarenaya hassleriana]